MIWKKFYASGIIEEKLIDVRGHEEDWGIGSE
jgi:hypothetical protein